MNKSFPSYSLADLHAHLATSINPSMYWQIAHAQGFKLPKKEYKEFINFVMLSEEKRMNLHDYFETIYHPILDKLSSGTYALETSVYQILSGAYRNNINILELRLNPMKHNLGGEQDLDHIILASLRGMERALLEYDQLSAGIIFCLAREFSYEQNEIIVQKAIKYHRRGVIAIDIAGPATKTFTLSEYKTLFQKAKMAGLRITVHSGETNDANDMWEVIEYLSPQRIGHGIKAAYDKKLMQEIVKHDIVLEVCPMSNLATKAIENKEELTFILRTLLENNVKVTINTDWPEIIDGAHLWKQFDMLQREKILTEEQLKHCNNIAIERTFIPSKGLNAYL
jgi:adenosine deaminase